MSLELDDPPYKAQFLDAQGYLAQPWMIWVRTVFLRIGKNKALSNTELEELPQVNLTALTARVATLETEQTSLTTQLSTAIDDFRKAPIP